MHFNWILLAQFALKFIVQTQLNLMFILFLLAFGVNTFAGVRLVQWNPSDRHATFVLPVQDQYTPEEGVQRFLESIRLNAEIRAVYNDSYSTLQVGTALEFQSDEVRSEVLILANQAEDMLPKGERIFELTELMERDSRLKTWVLPIAADLHLTRQERRDFHREVIMNFNGLMTVGGDDIHPRLYREQNRFSVSTNLARDLSEFRVVRSWLSEAQGFCLGICRGHQMIGVLDGGRLIQDIPTEAPSQIDHAEGAIHQVEVQKTNQNLLAGFVNGESRIEAYSWHHQALILREGSDLQVAARSDDGIIEALEFKDGRALTLQFHPEYLVQSAASAAILEGSRRRFQTASRGFRNRCERALQ